MLCNLCLSNPLDLPTSIYIFNSQRMLIPIHLRVYTCNQSETRDEVSLVEMRGFDIPFATRICPQIKLILYPTQRHRIRVDRHLFSRHHMESNQFLVADKTNRFIYLNDIYLCINKPIYLSIHESIQPIYTSKRYLSRFLVAVKKYIYPCMNPTNVYI